MQYLINNQLIGDVMKLCKITTLFAKIFPKKVKPVTIDTNAIFYGALREELDLLETAITFEYTEEGVPSTGKAIARMYRAAVDGVSTFKVFSGANLAKDLYFSAETNLAYRAVHDCDHAVAYCAGHGTTKREDELYLNCLMAKRAYVYAVKQGLGRKAAMLTFFHVYHDTVGQVHYYFEHNDFCADQKALTTKLVNECIGVKAVLANDLMLGTIVMQGMLRDCDVNFNLIK